MDWRLLVLVLIALALVGALFHELPGQIGPLQDDIQALANLVIHGHR